MVYTHKQTKVQYVLNEKLTRRQPENIIILKQLYGKFSERFYRNQIEQLFTIIKNMEKTAAEFKLESLQEDLKHSDSVKKQSDKTDLKDSKKHTAKN